MKIAVLMDCLSQITPAKDTTFALMLEAQKRGYSVYVFGQNDWFIKNGEPIANLKKVSLFDQDKNFYQILENATKNLTEFDVVLQRKDPPVEDNYFYDSYLLDLLVEAGVKVLNPPSALRALNEKMAISYVPQCCPETLITKNNRQIIDFVNQFKVAVIKPLNAMGGQGILQLRYDDPNLNALLEMINFDQNQTFMLQRFLDQVVDGDKRILLIHGQHIDHGLARLPKKGEFRANLAAGGRGEVRPLTERELWIVDQVKPLINKYKLAIVGLDVIGGFLTEINVTSPTCLREISFFTKQNLAGFFWDGI